MDWYKDESKLKAFQIGDRTFLAQLYKMYCKRISNLFQYGFTFSSKGKTVRFRGFSQSYQLQEAIQDSFLHAFRKEARLRYDPSRPYEPFLLTIAKNRMLDQIRKQNTASRYFVLASQFSAENETPQDTLDRIDSREQDSPETQAMRKQLQELIQTFITTLDSQDQAIVQLHMMGELTQTQVADHLGENRNDVRKRINTIRTKLLQNLKQSGFLSSPDQTSLKYDLLNQLMVMP